LRRQASLEVDKGTGAPGMYSPPSRVKGASGEQDLASGTAEEGEEEKEVDKTARTDATDADAKSARGLEQLGTFSLTTHESSLDLEVAPRQWKEAAFREELANFYAQSSWKNVVSIGDSVFERDALRHVISGRPTKQRRCRTKTTKLLDEPTIEELIKQLKVLHDGISLIVQYNGNLDIELDEEDLDFDISTIETMMGRD